MQRPIETLYEADKTFDEGWVHDADIACTSIAQQAYPTYETIRRTESDLHYHSAAQAGRY